MINVLMLAPVIGVEDPVSTIGAVADAFKVGNYWLAAVLVAMILVWGLRKFSGWLSTKWSVLSFLAWFGTKRGGAVLGFAVPFLLAMSTSLIAGSKMSLSLLLASISAGIGASGVFNTKKLAPAKK